MVTVMYALDKNSFWAVFPQTKPLLNEEEEKNQFEGGDEETPGEETPSGESENKKKKKKKKKNKGTDEPEGTVIDSVQPQSVSKSQKKAAPL